jgi:hypothetical protein
MVFPIIPVVATSAIILGTGSLIWYSNLAAEQKEMADRRANELAQEWYHQPLNRLSKFRFIQILLQVKGEFTGKHGDDPIGG